MRVHDIMTSAPLTIGSGASIAQAMRTMLDHHVSGLPVVDADGNLSGMLTESDFLRRAEIGTQRARPRWLAWLLSPGRIAAEYAHSHAGRVDEIMTHEVVDVDADAPLEDAVELLLRHRIKRLPVVKGGRLVGLLSRADLMRACLEAVPEESVAPSGDTALAARIAERMRQEASWCPRENIRIEVRKGVAEVLGVVVDERTREALRVLVENTPGVLRVVDHLTTVEPMTGAIVHPPG